MRLNHSRNIALDIGDIDKTKYRDFSGGIREDHYIDPESTFFEQIPKFIPSYPYDLDSHHGVMAPYSHKDIADSYIRMKRLSLGLYHNSHPPDLFETAFFQKFLKENGFPYDNVAEYLYSPGRCVRCGMPFGQKQLSKADGRNYWNTELCAHCIEHMDDEYDKTIDTSLFLKTADSTYVELEPELSIQSFFDKCILEMDEDKPRPESFVSITEGRYEQLAIEQFAIDATNFYWTTDSSRYDSGYMTFSNYNGTTYAHWTPMNTYTDTEAHHRYLINISSEINEMNAIDEEALERINDNIMRIEQQRLEQVEILEEMRSLTDVREITDHDITFAAV